MSIITEDEILEFYASKYGSAEASKRYSKELFREQKAALEDTSPFSASVCSRRAGKTHTIAARQILTCETKQYAMCPYIGITRRSAERIYIPKLEWFKDRYKINMEINYSKLEVTFPDTKIQICIVGAAKKNEIEKLRGNAYDDAAVDEAQSFGSHLKELIDDVLEPAMVDKRGRISLWGTPNAACVGIFHDATQKVIKGYSVHKWTLLDNPFIKDPVGWLKELRERRGWAESHPVYQREYLGMWVRSLDSMVYRYEDAKNLVESVDQKGFNYVVGVDLGTKDAFALGVVGWSDNDPSGYAIDCYKRSELTISDMAREIIRFRDMYDPQAIVADTGGLGKAIVEEMNQRYHLNIRPAEKQSKRDFIELINSDFVSGRQKVLKKCSDYIEELKILQWDEDGKKEDERYENDLCDAFLYAFREMKNWTHEPKARVPEIHSEEYIEEWWKKESDRLSEKSNREWWEDV